MVVFLEFSSNRTNFAKNSYVLTLSSGTRSLWRSYLQWPQCKLAVAMCAIGLCVRLLHMFDSWGVGAREARGAVNRGAGTGTATVSRGGPPASGGEKVTGHGCRCSLTRDGGQSGSGMGAFGLQIANGDIIVSIPRSMLHALRTKPKSRVRCVAMGIGSKRGRVSAILVSGIAPTRVPGRLRARRLSSVLSSCFSGCSSMVESLTSVWR